MQEPTWHIPKCRQLLRLCPLYFLLQRFALHAGSPDHPVATVEISQASVSFTLACSMENFHPRERSPPNKCQLDNEQIMFKYVLIDILGSASPSDCRWIKNHWLDVWGMPVRSNTNPNSFRIWGSMDDLHLFNGGQSQLLQRSLPKEAKPPMKLSMKSSPNQFLFLKLKLQRSSWTKIFLSD